MLNVLQEFSEVVFPRVAMDSQFLLEELYNRYSL
jgi:hypothetical protein